MLFRSEGEREGEERRERGREREGERGANGGQGKEMSGGVKFIPAEESTGEKERERERARERWGGKEMHNPNMTLSCFSGRRSLQGHRGSSC